MRTLKRAFSILELLAKTPQKPLLLNNIAGKVDLAVPTCARILSALVDIGYVEKHGVRQGFVLGPMAYALSFHGPYMANLVNIAGPILEKWAEHFQESILLAVLRGNQRYILYHANGNPDLVVQIHSFNNDDLYSTATGRTLLALADEEDQEAYITKHGAPGEAWPGAETMAGMRRQLQNIAKAKIFIAKTSRPLARFAVAVNLGNRAWAALGINLPASTFKGARRDAIIKGARKTAAEIEEAFNARIGMP